MTIPVSYSSIIHPPVPEVLRISSSYTGVPQLCHVLFIYTSYRRYGWYSYQNIILRTRYYEYQSRYFLAGLDAFFGSKIEKVSRFFRALDFSTYPFLGELFRVSHVNYQLVLIVVSTPRTSKYLLNTVLVCTCHPHLLFCSRIYIYPRFASTCFAYLGSLATSLLSDHIIVSRYEESGRTLGVLRMSLGRKNGLM